MQNPIHLKIQAQLYVVFLNVEKKIEEKSCGDFKKLFFCTIDYFTSFILFYLICDINHCATTYIKLLFKIGGMVQRYCAPLNTSLKS